MRISLGLYKTSQVKRERQELISSSAVWLSEDVVFIHDHLSKETAINTSRSNGRIHLASYDFDKNNSGFGNSIDVYVIFKKNSVPLLVGILRRSDGGLNSKHTILFELPLSEDEEAFSLARRNGFTVDPPDSETQWIDSDFISETYHDGSPVITTNTSTTYTKEITRAGYVSRKTGKPTLTKATVEKMLQNKFYYGVMEHDGVEYPHKYPPLINRALFNRCQQVKEQRGITSTKWNSLDFNFNDIVRCGKCNRSISSFKSKRWVYLKCANPQCKNPNTAESLVLGSIAELFNNITVPEDLVQQVLGELKKNHDDQQLFYNTSVESVRKEYDGIDKKLENWFDRLADEKVTLEKYDKIVERLTSRQKALNDKLDILTAGNKDFLVTASYLLELLARAKELFTVADEAQRSKLIGFMVSNLKLNDKKLSYTVNYPFDLVLEQK